MTDQTPPALARPGRCGDHRSRPQRAGLRRAAGPRRAGRGRAGGGRRPRRRHPHRAPVPQGARRCGQSTGLVPARADAAGAAARPSTCDIPVLRRDPHYFLPTPGGPGAPVPAVRLRPRGRPGRRSRRSSPPATWPPTRRCRSRSPRCARTSPRPGWPSRCPVEQTADRYIRPQLQATFVDLVRGSVADYLARFGFKQRTAGQHVRRHRRPVRPQRRPGRPGHRTQLPRAQHVPAARRRRHLDDRRGRHGHRVPHLRRRGPGGRGQHRDRTPGSPPSPWTAARPSGVVLADGRAIAAGVVLGACDPYRLMDLVPDGALPADADRPDGRGPPHRHHPQDQPGAVRPAPLLLPAARTRPSPFGVHHPPAARLRARSSGRGGESTRWRRCGRCGPTCRPAGCPPSRPSSGTCTPPSTRRCATPAGHHSSALFVQSVPYTLAGTTWDAELPGYVDRLLEICDRYAPGTGRPGRRRDAADAARHRGALRHHRRAHPPRRQHRRVRPTGCRTPPASTACTPAAPAATRRAA